MSAETYADTAKQVSTATTSTPEPGVESIETVAAEKPPQDSTDSHLPSPKASPKNAKQQVKLAPAPVPEVSAWGSSSTEGSRSNSNVDSKHWPSPLEVPQQQLQQQQSNGKKQGVVKNTSKEKWVPFNASVVLAQPAKKSTQKRNQKNHGTLNNKQVTSDAKKRKNKSKQGSHNSSQQLQSQQSQSQQQAQQAQQAQHQSQQQCQSQEQSQAQDSVKSSTNGTVSSTDSTEKPGVVSQQQQTQSTQHQHHNHYHNHRHHHHNHHQNVANGGANANQHYPQQFAQGSRPFRPYNGNGNRRFNKNGGPFRYNNGHYNNQAGGYPQGFYYNARNFIVNKNEPTYSLTKQIEYYFSIENLAKDLFLRKHMNSEGWLNYEVVANFYRMQVLSGNDLSLVKKVLLELNGALIEVGEVGELTVIRVKDNYKIWVLPGEQRLANVEGEVTIISPKVDKAEAETAETTEAAAETAQASEENDKQH